MLKLSGLLLLVVAYGLLIPGLTQPMLSVSGTVEKSKLVEVGREIIEESDGVPNFVKPMIEQMIDNIDARGSVAAFDKTRSIVETAEELRANGHLFVAVLIVLFSVVVPLFKALVLAAALLPIRRDWRARLAGIANASGKWSMADVFVIAIFVAFLAGNGIQENSGLVDFEASLGIGFNYFLAYCLVSLVGTQLLVAGLRRDVARRGATSASASASVRADVPTSVAASDQSDTVSPVTAEPRLPDGS